MLLSPRRQNIESRTCHRAACRRKSRSLNGKVLLLLAIFWAVKCLFSHNNLAVSHYYYHLASSPSSPCPSKGYLTNILPEIVCIGGRSILCCSFATAAPASCIHGCVCLSARLSLCTLLITLPSTQQWHNWLLSYPLLRFTLSALYGAGLKHVSLDVKSNSAVLSRGVTAFWTTKMRCDVALGNETLVCRRYTRLFTIHSSQPDTPDCSHYTVSSQIHQTVHNTQYPARYTRLYTIRSIQPDTPDCSQYTAASQIHQTVHNTQLPARYTRLFTIHSSQPDTPDCTQYSVSSQIHQNVHNTQQPARYTKIFTIHSCQPDTPDCSQYTVSSHTHQTVHNTQYPARYTRLFIIHSSQPDTPDCAQYTVASPIHQTVHNTQ